MRGRSTTWACSATSAAMRWRRFRSFAVRSRRILVRRVVICTWGLVLEQSADFEGALGAYREAARLEPRAADAHFNQGLMLLRLDRPREAEECFRRVLVAVPGDAEAALNLGHALARQRRWEHALDAFERALSHRSGWVAAQNGKGGALRRMGRHPEALAVYRRALAVAPKNAGLHNNLGNVLNELGRHCEAKQAFERAIDLDSRLPEAHLNLGRLRREEGDLAGARSACRRALALDPNLAGARPALASMLQGYLTPRFDPALASELLRLMRSLDVESQDLALAAASQVRARHRLPPRRDGEEGGAALPVVALARDELLREPARPHSQRRPRPRGDPRRTAPHIAVRSVAGRGGRTGSGDRTPLRGPRAAVLRQRIPLRIERSGGGSGRGSCEGVRAAVCRGRPRNARTTGPAAPRNVPAAVAGGSRARTRACRRVGPGRRASPGWWSARSSSRSGNGASPRASLPRDRSTIPFPAGCRPSTRQDPIRDGSRSPPRTARRCWRASCDDSPTGSRARAFATGSRALVLGCGSGYEPIELALREPGFRVIAVDLSLASLAYATRMAGRQGVENVHFLHGDLLDLPEVDGSFDLVSATGVLHHMRDPLAGWKAAASRLAEGGLMRVGLYSATARRSIARAREIIRRRGIATTAEGLRAFRLSLLRGELGPEFAELTRSPDLYSESGLRDLLFHVEEHHFDLEGVASALSRLGLRFVGFEHQQPGTAYAYARMFPDDPSQTSLANWSAFEAAHPETFNGMYQFWCEQPASSSA